MIARMAGAVKHNRSAARWQVQVQMIRTRIFIRKQLHISVRRNE